MPGILPMKLIKSSNNQTRIAQACDRCRSKKIRCDGIRPSVRTSIDDVPHSNTENKQQCSQCAAVGFECKTSDKLSRRAFPRGYTESLEERVRALEAENRELKDLLDAKDEQIDVLSRIHSFSPYSPSASVSATERVRRASSVTSAPNSLPGTEEIEETSNKESFSVPQSNTLIHDDCMGDFFAGSSSGRAFVEAFKVKMESSGLLTSNFDTELFFSKRAIVRRSSAPAASSNEATIRPPPRMIADLLLTSFFQEYHPLFPVLHRPSFLQLYENLVELDGSSPNYPRQPHEIAQLFLVFAIASAQTEARNSPQHTGFEIQWQQALDRLLMIHSFETLQCLVLAQLYCISIGDNTKLLQYKSLAVAIAFRLGLNRNQKEFTLNTLDHEMRKRVFWCVYCLDAFSAATTGMPMVMQDQDVDVEYPADVDDEYISDKGLLPTLPGDYTKISSSIALFRAARVLSKTLSSIYSGSDKRKLPYSVLQDLEDQLNLWKATLAPHLRLEFTNGMPATNIVHNRSPLLVAAYHFIRVLIYRAIIGTSTALAATATIHAVAESSRYMFQIIKLLDERKLGFSMCINRNETLVLCGFAILNASLDYSQTGQQAKENQKIVSEIILMLHKRHYPLRREFRNIAALVFKGDKRDVACDQQQFVPSLDALVSPNAMAMHNVQRSTSTPMMNDEDVDAIINGSVSDSFSIYPSTNRGLMLQGNANRMSLPTPLNTSAAAMDAYGSVRTRRKILSPIESAFANLDLFSWAIDAPVVPPQVPTSSSSEDDWEKMVASIDHNQGSLIYGDMQQTDQESLYSPQSLHKHDRRSSSSTWSIESWNIHQALHPTAASISSFSALAEESPAPFFDSAQLPLMTQLAGMDPSLINTDWSF